jgi:hypothetical protein
MSVYLNNNSSIQPSELSEDITQKVVNIETIGGLYFRYWQAQKYSVKMTFSAITTAQWQQLMGYLANGAEPVTYRNSQSGFSFSGFATTAAASYLHGESYLRDMTVTIMQQ